MQWMRTGTPCALGGPDGANMRRILIMDARGMLEWRISEGR